MSTPARYVLRCSGCGETTDDDGITLACANGCAGLLQSDYAERRFLPDDAASGTFRYHRWLPIRRRFDDSGSPAIFAAAAWGRRYGIEDLWFAFSGLWPQRGASLETATFKELEADTVLARMPQNGGETLVVASAGNTAAAFARACSKAGRRCAIVVPSSALARLRFFEPLAPCVAIVAIAGTYDHAIAFSRKLAARPGFVLEGGVRNVARRDGMGTVMLAAVERMGTIPNAYVQAVGSGAGALAANEAARRLVRDGRFGSRVPRLMLAQNVPFTPMVDSWATRSEKLVAVDPERARERIAAIGATVLSNQAPPYAIPGGMYDALRSSDGEMFGVTNEAAAGVAERFLAEEGVDLEPAAAVALASLPAVAATLGANAGRVLVHLTGGGWTTFYEPSAGPPVEPTLTLTVADAEDPRALDRVEAAFERASRRPMSAPIAPLAASSTIVIAESLAGGSLEPFEHLDARVRYEPALANDRAALLRAVRNATALVVRNTVRVDRELLAAAPALRAIGRLGTGLDNIDVEAARERGIPIVDSGRANANAVAEYVLAAMLSSERRIDACDDAVRSGAWPRFHMSFGELLGKTLGIVGLGRCGSRLALVARALGMDVLGTRRTPDLPPALADTGVERVELDELLGRAQYVVLLMPPLASGAAAIGAAELRRMRTDAVLINPGRGSLVDEAALLAALDAGRLRGAVLDTRAHEPPEANDPLVAHPLVTSTPHVAGLTAEAQLRVGAIVARGIGRAIGAPAPARARV